MDVQKSGIYFRPNCNSEQNSGRNRPRNGGAVLHRTWARPEEDSMKVANKEIRLQLNGPIYGSAQIVSPLRTGIQIASFNGHNSESANKNSSLLAGNKTTSFNGHKFESANRFRAFIKALIAATMPATRLMVTALLFLSSALLAQDRPSVLFLRNTNQGWVLEMHFGDDLYRAMEKSGIHVRTLSDEDLKKAVVHYIESGLKIVSREGLPAEPNPIRVATDRHFAMIEFQLRNWKPESSPLNVVILAGSENPGHTNVLRLPDGQSVVLRKANHFAMDLSLPGSSDSFGNTIENLNYAGYPLWFLAPLMALTTIFFWLGRNKKSVLPDELEP